MRARHACPLVLIGVLLFCGTAAAQKQGGDPPSPATLVDRIRGLIAAAALGDQVGVSVVSLRTGREVASSHAQLALNPASNMKLVTAALALKELGPEFTMLTGLYGRRQGSAIVGGLYLKGFGDPSLTSADFIALGQDLAAAGIRSVDELIVDGSYFDDQVLPPAFDQQPKEISPFRAAVAAVSVNRNAYTLRVRPGPTAGSPTRVHTDASGHFVIENKMTTTAAGAPNVVAIQGAKDDALSLKLRGSVPLGTGTLSYRRRVESPLHFAGHELLDILKDLKMQIPRRVRIGKTPRGAALLASRRSPPLAHLLASLGKNSDNFVAEMVLKVVGAEKAGQPGKSADGAAMATAMLKKMGVPVTKLSIVNGSGLFEGNRIAAAHLTRMLAAVYADPSIRADYLGQLAIGGVDGTLRKRLTDLAAPRVVRAKTGTLNDTIALGGYVLGRTPDRGFAFAVLANGVRGKHAAARQLADDIARAMALHLWAKPKPSP